MQLSDFDYNLPKELIASNHMEPRDHSRLLVLDRDSGGIEHKLFCNILDHLRSGDLLVFNNSMVFKARAYGVKKTGGKIELLLIRPIDDLSWETLVKGKVSVGDDIFLERGLEAKLLEKKDDSTCTILFNKNSDSVFRYLEKYGEMPLPPYISKIQKSKFKNQSFSVPSGQYIELEKPSKKNIGENGFYQTVYAKKTGSVAAPTAGFHFTSGLLKKIKTKGVECLDITLHVGPGTFMPVKSKNIPEHKMHEEFFEVSRSVWNKVLRAKKEGRRVVAVGTTTARVLESLGGSQNSKVKSYDYLHLCNPKDLKNPNDPNDPKIIGSTKVFIYPPYTFRVVDALITNFHLPKSTLMMLVSAFAASGGMSGTKKIKKAYSEAVDLGYRFFSFGDSMFIK